MAPDPFAEGRLPSQYEEAQPLAAVQQLLREQVDMQFSDLRALLRLPNDEIAPLLAIGASGARVLPLRDEEQRLRPSPEPGHANRRRSPDGLTIRARRVAQR